MRSAADRSSSAAATAAFARCLFEPARRRRRRALLAALLLPALLLRALIPSGFMPASTGLEFCDGGFHVGAALHGHHRGMPGSPTGAAHGDGCVFAGSAAGLAPAPASAADAVLAPAAASLALPESAERVFFPILRAQSPRGPPSLP